MGTNNHQSTFLFEGYVALIAPSKPSLYLYSAMCHGHFALCYFLYNILEIVLVCQQTPINRAYSQ